MQTESKIINKLTYWGSVLVLGTILGVSLQYASAAWTAPSGAAPTGNVNGPITTSTTTQTKAGKIETAATVIGDTSSTLVTKGYLEANYVNAASAQQVRGGHYGGCYQQMDASSGTEYVSYSGFIAWPVTSCGSVGSSGTSAWAKCALGYTPILISRSQGNTGARGVDYNGISRFDDRLDTMWNIWTCAKT